MQIMHVLLQEYINVKQTQKTRHKLPELQELPDTKEMGKEAQHRTKHRMIIGFRSNPRPAGQSRTTEGDSPIVQVPGDVPPARVYFFKLSSLAKGIHFANLVHLD